MFWPSMKAYNGSRIFIREAVIFCDESPGLLLNCISFSIFGRFLGGLVEGPIPLRR